jgi:hypothetical protein
VIETTKLELIPCGLKHFEAILRHQERLGQMLGVPVVEDDSSVGAAHHGGRRASKRLTYRSTRKEVR